MLLPSALSCDGGRVIPSSAGMLLSPAPRRDLRLPQERSSSLAMSLFDNRFDTASASIGSSTVEGIFTTCKKLHQILSLESNRSASIPIPATLVSATTQTHNAFNLAITSSSPLPRAPSTPPRVNRASQVVSTPKHATNRLAVPPMCAIPTTPSPKKTHAVLLPKTPMRRNKRRRDSDSDDGFYHIVRDQSPKRPRLTIIPPTTSSTITKSVSSNPRFNRRCRQLRMAPTVLEQQSTSSEPIVFTPAPLKREDSSSSVELVAPVEERPQDWSHAEDRLLVELVLQKLRLSARDWADCARTLGRDPRTVGNRWESIIGGLTGSGVREGRIGDKKRRRIEDVGDVSKRR
ncbi:hypothetical protein DFH27DRAFT_345431 [Peziza echinospora]|nr:hypothetical protein DFH27DRAFT_345431 [Peziza echinospora]